MYIDTNAVMLFLFCVFVVAPVLDFCMELGFDLWEDQLAWVEPWWQRSRFVGMLGLRNATARLCWVMFAMMVLVSVWVGP